MKERVVVVTGAAGGIGSSIAKRFHKAHAIVIAVDHFSAKEKLVKITTGLGILGLLGDVSDIDDVGRMIDPIMNSFGRIDVLVNAAGILVSDGVLAKTKKENLLKLKSVMNINYWGTFHCCYVVLPHMRAREYGRIINISSIMAGCADPGNIVYSSSKAAVSSFTKTLAHEAPFNKDGVPFDITVNAVAPGIIETAMTEGLHGKYMEQYYMRVPSQRKGKPEEIADAVYFLANNQYMNGVILPVDGGYTAK
ncbi:MAG: SDR family oxidoreductase [bacterium]|nr:SDR family oxidoreductase [bacterium]